SGLASFDIRQEQAREATIRFDTVNTSALLDLTGKREQDARSPQQRVFDAGCGKHFPQPLQLRLLVGRHVEILSLYAGVCQANLPLELSTEGVYHTHPRVS